MPSSTTRCAAGSRSGLLSALVQPPLGPTLTGHVTLAVQPHSRNCKPGCT